MKRNFVLKMEESNACKDQTTSCNESAERASSKKYNEMYASILDDLQKYSFGMNDDLVKFEKERDRYKAMFERADKAYECEKERRTKAEIELTELKKRLPELETELVSERKNNGKILKDMESDAETLKKKVEENEAKNSRQNEELKEKCNVVIQKYEFLKVEMAALKKIKAEESSNSSKDLQTKLKLEMEKCHNLSKELERYKNSFNDRVTDEEFIKKLPEYLSPMAEDYRKMVRENFQLKEKAVIQEKSYLRSLEAFQQLMREAYNPLET